MLAIIAFSCLLATSMAAPAAEADPQLLVAGTVGGAAVATLPALVGAAVAAPVAVAPVLPSNCVIEHEEIETQVCTPHAVSECETQEVVSQHVEYEPICKEVTSKHCANAPAYLRRKREAGDARSGKQLWGGYHHAGLLAAAPVAAAYHHTVEATVTTGCHEVTAEHCLQSPKIVDTPTPIQHCHLVQKVKCVPQVEKIAKTVCEPVETKVVRHAVNPFAYGYGWGK